MTARVRASPAEPMTIAVRLWEGDGREDHQDEVRRGDGVAGHEQVHEEDDHEAQQRHHETERAPLTQPRHGRDDR